MQDFLKRIQAGEIIVSDGAMGSMCIEAGLKVGDCPELFNLDHADIIARIMESYFNAGAQIVHTNTFGGSPLKLEPYGLRDRAAEINARAVEIARDAVGDKTYISGSCGPSGKILKPYGDTADEHGEHHHPA